MKAGKIEIQGDTVITDIPADAVKLYVSPEIADLLLGALETNEKYARLALKSAVEAKDVLVNEELERSLLGALLLDPDAIAAVIPISRSGDFYNTRHQAIAQAMFELADERIMPSVANTIWKLDDMGMLKLAGGEAYIKALPKLLIGKRPTLDVPIWARRIMSLSERRALRDLMLDVHDVAEDLNIEHEELLAEVSRRVLQGRQRLVSDYMPLGETVNDLRPLVEQWLSGSKAGFLPTGLYSLDYYFIGLPLGQLVILVGRTGHGKTQLALNLRKAVEEHGYNVMFSSLEMSRTELAVRELTMLAGIDSMKLKRGELANDPDAIQRVRSALDRMERYKTHVGDATLQTSRQMLYKAQLLALKQGGLHFHMVDYAELVDSPDGKRPDSEALRIRQVYVDEKDLCKTVGCCGLVLSQTTKKAIYRVPTAEDVMYGGESAADGIIGIWNPEITWKDHAGEFNMPKWVYPDSLSGIVKPDPNVVYLSITKFRHGQTVPHIPVSVNWATGVMKDHPKMLERLGINTKVAQPNTSW